MTNSLYYNFDQDFNTNTNIKLLQKALKIEFCNVTNFNVEKFNKHANNKLIHFAITNSGSQTLNTRFVFANSLQKLKLRGCGITNIQNLLQFPHLSQLDLNQNLLTSLDQIQDLKYLKQLFVANNMLVSLGSINKLINLIVLVAYNNQLPISEISKASKIASLKQFEIYGNQVSLEQVLEQIHGGIWFLQAQACSIYDAQPSSNDLDSLQSNPLVIVHKSEFELFQNVKKRVCDSGKLQISLQQSRKYNAIIKYNVNNLGTHITSFSEWLTNIQCKIE